MKSIKRFLRANLGFSKVEVNATIVILFLSLTLVVIQIFVVPKVFQTKPNVEMDKRLLTEWIVEIENSRPQTIDPHVLPNFDPNTIPVDSLILYGFANKAARQIINYRNKGGVFKYKDDLYKIYSVDSTLITSLWGKINLLPKRKVLSKRKRTEIKSVKKSSKPNIKKIDINKATQDDFKMITGIGQTLSDRIVRFRDKLGGFHSSSQLCEVYGIRPEVCKNATDRFFVKEDFQPRKRNINKVTFKELLSHPYFSYETVKAIFGPKGNRTKYKSIEEVASLKTVPDSVFNRFKPYITVE